MAHQDIRRLTNELDAAKNNNVEPSGTLQTCVPDYQVICTDCSYSNIFCDFSNLKQGWIKRPHLTCLHFHLFHGFF